LASKKEQREQARREREEREAKERAAAQRKRRLSMVGAALAAAAVVVVVAILVSSSGSDSNGGSPKGPAAGASDATKLLAGIPQKGHVLGQENAPVTLHEFADLQCPHCRDFTTTVFPTIVKNYVRTGKVKIVFHNFAILGEDSVSAGFAAEAAAKQDKLFDFVDVFYANQGPERSGYVTDAFIKKIAGAVPGLDVDKLLKDRTDPAIQQTLAEVEQEAQQRGIDGTPGFLLQKDSGPLQKLDLGPTDLNGFTQTLNQALGGGT
jgi:protein-disulfide isomerase